MKKIDYKGKYFMLQDDSYYLGDMDFEIGTMEDEEITDDFLKIHVINCNYYGIPPYIGDNKHLKEKILKFQKEYESLEA